MGQTSNLRLSDQLCFALYSAATTVVRTYRPLLEQIGLTYPQYLVMLVLWENDDRSISELAEALDLPANGVGPMIDRLEKRGLLTRVPDPRDGRSKRIHLTAAGTDLELDASRVQADVVCRTQLTPEALDELRDSVRDLVEVLAPDTPCDVPQPIDAPGAAPRSDL